MKKTWLTTSNKLILVITYLSIATFSSTAIFSKGNQAAPDLTTRIVLVAFVLLVAAPCFAICVLLMRLRIENFLKTKDIFEFMLPTKGSLGNPDVSPSGSIGDRVFKLILVGILALLIFVFFGLPFLVD